MFVSLRWTKRHPSIRLYSNQIHHTTHQETMPLDSMDIPVWTQRKYITLFTVKPDVLFPPILQDCRQYCNVHALLLRASCTGTCKLQLYQFNKFVDFNTFVADFR